MGRWSSDNRRMEKDMRRENSFSWKVVYYDESFSCSLSLIRVRRLLLSPTNVCNLIKIAFVRNKKEKTSRLFSFEANNETRKKCIARNGCFFKSNKYRGIESIVGIMNHLVLLPLQRDIIIINILIVTSSSFC